MPQSFVRWQSPPALSNWLESATLTVFPNSSAVILLSTGEAFLKVAFSSTEAISSHDEMTHWLADEANADIPQLPCGGAYPLLIVKDSVWAENRPILCREMNNEQPTHYLFVTLNNYVDVLSYSDPVVESVDAQAWDRMFDVIAP